jgi:serine/threonine protein kinase
MSNLGNLPFMDKNMSKLYVSIMSAKYAMPDFISEEAKTLLKHLLTAKPDLRANFDDIRAHPWTNLGNQPLLKNETFIGIA